MPKRHHRPVDSTPVLIASRSQGAVGAVASGGNVPSARRTTMATARATIARPSIHVGPIRVGPLAGLCICCVMANTSAEMIAPCRPDRYRAFDAIGVDVALSSLSQG